MLKIATWNVNSVRSRLERLIAFLARHDPDIVCLQELKTPDETYPSEDIEKAGYHSAVFGQKTYNGVAVLSKNESKILALGMDDGADDPQSRLIAVEISGVTVISAYFPNGGTVGSDKWEYKLDWMHRLKSYLEKHHKKNKPLLLCGDTNIAIDDNDVAEPDKWAGTVLCHPDGRAAFCDIIDWGLRDVFREKNPGGWVFSWWDYRQLAFPRDDGLRIDHILATKPLADKCVSAIVDRDERKGSKPSDHAPVIAEFDY